MSRMRTGDAVLAVLIADGLIVHAIGTMISDHGPTRPKGHPGPKPRWRTRKRAASAR